MREKTITFAERPWVKNLGVAIAVISFIGSIYMWFFYKKAPNYEYDIVSQSALLVNHTELPTVKIYVDSVDIHHSEENISIIEIRVSNTGKASLRRDDYDISDFGLKLLNGQLLAVPELSGVSSNFVRDCFTRHHFANSGSFINMPILPLDSKEFYQFKLIVLHKDNESVSLEPIGKIIGQREIVINDAVRSDATFITRVFDENIWIHLVRLLLYLILLFSVLIFVIAVNDKKDERKKALALQEILDSKQFSTDVINAYKKHGFNLFDDLMQIYNIPEKELYKKYMSSLNYTKYERNKVNVEHWQFHHERIEIFKYMLKNSYLVMTGTQIRFDKNRKKSVTEFYGLLLEKGLVPYNLREHYKNEMIGYSSDNKYYLEA